MPRNGRVLYEEPNLGGVISGVGGLCCGAGVTMPDRRIVVSALDESSNPYPLNSCCRLGGVGSSEGVVEVLGVEGERLDLLSPLLLAKGSTPAVLN